MTPPAFSVEEIEQAIEQGLAVITLMQLRDALQSGQVAILSREDRESAFNAAWDGALKLGNGEDGEADAMEREARRLLRLDGGTTP